MKIKIVIDCSNAAFEHVGDTYEVSRILRDLAGRIVVAVGNKQPIMDLNGNRVGEWKVTR